MTEPTYRIQTTFQPGVTIGVRQQEYEHLNEQGAVAVLVEVLAPVRAVYVQTDEPAQVVGRVWLNPTIPAT